jgi:phospholipid/cholesterol/gamma-HCH transport system substrate-binding protein
MRFRIRNADTLVGLFVLIAALFLVGGVVFLGANQRWFARDVRFTTRFQSATGAAPGTAIMMRGFQVGKVTKLRLNENNEVDGEFVIFDSYYAKVKEHSIIELVTSPIGLGTQLLFHPGTGGIVAVPGSFIPLADSDEGKELIAKGLVEIPVKDDTISRLLASVNPLVENVNTTVVSVNKTLVELNRALEGQSHGPLGTIVNSAADAATRADAVVADVSGQASSLVKKTNELLESANAITKNLEATTAAIRDPTGLVPKLLDAKGSVKTLLDDHNALYDSIQGSVAELQNTLKNVQDISTALDGEMPSIAVAVDESRTAIKQAQDVLTGLKNNPLLKGGIPARLEEDGQNQSLRGGQF